MKRTISLLLGSILGLGFSPLAAEEGELLSIAEIAAYTPDSFSTLTAALVTTGLAETLNEEGSFTVFAPTNTAFDDAAKALLGHEDATGLELLLTLDRETLANILLLHVVPGTLFSDDVLDRKRFETASGDVLTREDFTIFGGQGSSGTLVEGLINLEASNGVVHVIDGVLLPPEKEELVSIFELAEKTPALSTLVAAIEKAHLSGILSNEHFKFTVFAPLNSAFDRAAQEAFGDESATGMDLVEALSPWELRRIILGHALWGERFSDSILASTHFRTLWFARLKRDDLTIISRNGSGTLVPDLIDLETTNGVVHVVDGVLLP